MGVTDRKDGYMDGGGWLISWCVGHLAEPAAYDPDYAKWRQEDLPILPESWRFTIRTDKRSLSRHGIGMPVTRDGILEKLVASGLVERKKTKKITNLLPTQAGSSLITVLPEALQSPLLTAEWKQRLGEVEHGTLTPEYFMDGTAALVRNLVRDYQSVPGWEVLFPSDRETVGPCPRCGRAVTESKKGFFCENRDYRVALWKDSKFFSAETKSLTKSVAAALLKDGQARLIGCFSEKTGRTYDATIVLEDDGAQTNYRLEFERRS